MTRIGQLIERLVEIPVVYDWSQKVLGAEKSKRRLAPLLRLFEGVVLDIGGGTGLFRPLVPASARYVCLDIDERKLAGFRRKFGSGFDIAIQADATKLCFHDQSIDFSLCIAVLHHLADEQLPRLFDEIARVTKKQLIVLEPLQAPNRRTGQFLWKYDQGSHPRTATTIMEALETRFDLIEHGQHSIYHEYLVCVAAPKNGR